MKTLKKKKSEWQLQEAKNSLSEVVNLALTEGAQTITRHGKPVVVVVSQEEFKKLQPEKEAGFDLLATLRACPDGDLLCEVLEKHHDDFRGEVGNLEL